MNLNWNIKEKVHLHVSINNRVQTKENCKKNSVLRLTIVTIYTENNGKTILIHCCECRSMIKICTKQAQAAQVTLLQIKSLYKLLLCPMVHSLCSRFACDKTLLSTTFQTKKYKVIFFIWMLMRLLYKNDKQYHTNVLMSYHPPPVPTRLTHASSNDVITAPTVCVYSVVCKGEYHLQLIVSQSCYNF